MKRVGLAIGCFLGIAVAGTASYLLEGSPEPARETGDNASSSQGEDAPAPPAGYEALAQRVAQLETRVKELEGDSPPNAAREADAISPTQEEPPGEPGTESAAATTGDAAEKASSPVTRGEVKKLVRAELEARRKERERQWAESQKKPKRTVEEVSQELALDARQETQIRGLYQGLSNESMKVLFAIEEDAGLEQLKLQLAEAEYNPGLKAKLREQIAINWTRHKNEFSVMYVKLDADLRKILDEEKLKSWYSYDVQLAEPEWPDIEKMFFREDKGEGKE